MVDWAEQIKETVDQIEAAWIRYYKVREANRYG